MSQGTAGGMCFSKKRYGSMAEAYESIERQKRGNPRAAMLTLRPYHCPVCTGYHVTKSPAPKDAEIQKKRFLQGLDI